MIHDYARYDRVRAVAFKGDRLELLDQRRLPFKQDFIACENADDVAEAIFQLIVRGAPAIGIAAAWGVVLASREVEAAKADGRWNAAYHSFSGMEVPAELAAALKKNKKAKACFDQLDRTNRYSFCWRMRTARKPETRLARAAKFVEMLARGEKIH